MINSFVLSGLAFVICGYVFTAHSAPWALISLYWLLVGIKNLQGGK